MSQTEQNPHLTRRGLLAAAGLGAVIVLEPMTPAAAASGTVTTTVTGHVDPGPADFVYLPVDVPDGVQQISVSYAYSKPTVPSGTPGNSCDIGIFDERGISPELRGFRGWSGGFRTQFSISASEATPGYLPGPVGRGRWHIVLGPYQVAPAGLDYEVSVALTYGPAGTQYRPQYPALSATGRGRAWYRGDCHLHTVYSDGRRLPAQVAAEARTAGLDFIVSTDHNTSSSHGVWGPLAGEDLLIVTGEEVTTRNGHWLALGLKPGTTIDWRYRSRDDRIDDAVRQVHAQHGLAVSAHLYCPWIGCEWKFGFDDLDATEVWTGPWGWDDEAAVSTWANLLATSAQRGDRRWLPAMGNSDAHNPGQTVGLPHNVVLADRLDRDGVLSALKAGRTWIAESSAIDLSLVLQHRGRQIGIGDRLRGRPTEPLTAHLSVSGVPGGTLRLLTDQGQMVQSALPSSGTGSVTWTTTPQAAAFVRAEVRHPLANGAPGGTTMDPTAGFGAMAALTNPIWIDRL